MFLVVLYLATIVAANLLVAQFGPAVSIVNAFLFIGLDITTRDALHEKWHGKNMWLKMMLLIGAGSVLSAALNWNAARIALASFVAFAAAGVVDTVIYNFLYKKSRLVKINGSNIGAALIDSIVFPAVAFGFPLLWLIMLGQFAAKIGGGFVWSLIMKNENIFTRREV
jgi:hypothetical protein